MAVANRLVSRPPFDWQWFARRLHRCYPRCVQLPLALVSIAAQRLYLIERRRLVGSYRISSSRYGVGTLRHSLRTPLGAHCVFEKIGADHKPLTLFKGRKAVRQCATLNPLATVSTGDAICTRILWLDGLEAGYNRGGYLDSARRCIYIHGTVDERRLGRPASIGCIRMGNDDVLEVFDALAVNSLVYISQ